MVPPTDAEADASAAASADPPPGPGTSASGASAGTGAGPPWHTLGVDEVAARLDVDLRLGLSADEVLRRRERHGRNELLHDEGPGPWAILAGQFTEPLVLVLLAAALLSGGIWWAGSAGDEALPWDALVIAAIVLLNAVIGFVQEYRAERAVEALKSMTAPEARVRRDGEERRVDAADLVPGDVLLLQEGDRIAADARLVESASLKVEEAALTGESEPVSKQVAPLDDPDLEVAERRTLVFTASAVTYGHGEAVVVATGMETQVGGIAGLIQATPDEATPLQRELSGVGRQLGVLVLGISVVVTVAGVLREGSLTLDVVLQMFLFGVALAVAAVPEGLPAVVTATLALGMRRLAARQAVVRSLPAVEALGSATVICTDKTGTLTRNEMTVRRLLTGDGREVGVGGEGYRPEGDLTWLDTGEAAAEDPAILRLLRLAALDNDARLIPPDDASGGPGGGIWTISGDPTEAALVVAAEKGGIDVAGLREAHPRLAEIPFSSDRRRMTTVHDLDGGRVAAVKGAPEVILDRCDRIRTADGTAPLDDGTRRRIDEANEAFAGDALRTLAVASGEAPETGAEPHPDEVERGLVFEGLMGMIDPPRDEARAAVATARRAGIRTIMVTGDHTATARAIAGELGIGEGDPPEVLAGRDVARMDDDELRSAVASCCVFGRVDPEIKYRIVKALQAGGEVVAMTGDGVNDAPAVKTADIGVAMGRSGSDVTREAGDIVLADDDYATIVAAVEEGRTIFANLQSFIRYLLSANAGEVLTILGAVAGASLLGLEGGTAGFILPLLPVQILWINLVTDGPPALALGVSPGEPGLMERPPRDPQRRVIDGSMWLLFAVSGVTIMVGTLAVLDAYLPGGTTHLLEGAGDGGDPLARARSAAFTTLMLFQMVHVFNCLSGERSLTASGVLRNRWLLAAVAGSLLLQVAVLELPLLQRAFGTVSLSLRDWAVAGGVAVSLIVPVEILKAVLRARGTRRAPMQR